MIPFAISIKNLAGKIALLSSKRFNSHNIESGLNSQKGLINQQITNNQIAEQVNYYKVDNEKLGEKAIDDKSVIQGEAIPLDPISIDSFSSEIWNKVF